MQKPKLTVQYIETDRLIPYVNNARTHSDEQISQIAASIKEFGFNNPVLVDGENGIIAGHGRVAAAKKLGMDKVPVIELSHLSDVQRRAYILADNRLAENAEWDFDLVNLELEALQGDGFDISLTGFDIVDIEDEEKKESKYTDIIGTPQYEIQGDNPTLNNCFDLSKTNDLIAEIENSGVSEEEKQFLKAAAYRHASFHYRNVAEYYAEASPEMQELMEKSALVIIDIDDAIKNGYAKMSKQLKEIIYDED